MAMFKPPWIPKARDRASVEEGDIWNLFVQILMPLLLVVTFFALFSIVYYNAYTKTILAGEERKKIEEDTSALKANYYYDKVDLQRLRLLFCLDTIKDRETAKAGGFIAGARFLLTGKEDDLIRDSSFLRLCEYSGKHFTGPEQRACLGDSLYVRVLRRARLSDHSSGEIRNQGTQRWSYYIHHCDTEYSRQSDMRFLETNDDEAITPGNRCALSKDIESFLNSLETKIVANERRIFNRIVWNDLKTFMADSAFAAAILRITSNAEKKEQDRGVRESLEVIKVKSRVMCQNRFGFLAGALELDWQ